MQVLPPVIGVTDDHRLLCMVQEHTHMHSDQNYTMPELLSTLGQSAASSESIIFLQDFKGFRNRARLGLARTCADINGFKYANKTPIPDISRNCGYQLFSLCLCLRFFYVRDTIRSYLPKIRSFLSDIKKHHIHVQTQTLQNVFAFSFAFCL